MTPPARILRRALPALLLATLALPAHADGSWVIEQVDAAGVSPNDCAFTSIALDPQGVPHIVYSWGVEPRVSSRGIAGWTHETLVTPPAGPGAAARPAGIELLNICWPSLAIDPVSGEPRVGYLKLLRSDNWYAERSAGVWTYQYVVHNSGTPFIAIDAAGGPHEMIGGMYWMRTSGTWSYETVAPNATWAPLQLDALGRPHVSISTGGDLEYASRETGSWVLEDPDPSTMNSQMHSLALDAAGNPRIAYEDPDLRALRYAHREGGTWTLETVGGRAGWVSLALLGGNEPFIAYYDSLGDDLRLAHRVGGSWTSEVVDGSAGVGRYCSLAIDGAGHPHIGYYDQPHGRVTYATSSAVAIVEEPRPEARFRIARAFPNPLPAGGRLLLDLRLPAPRTVTVELLDVAGRVLARHEPVAMAAGDPVLAWTPAVRASGLCFLRARTDRGETAMRRLAVTR